MRKLQSTNEIELEWRSFLLRPRPALEPRSLEEFRTYTESWRRCDAEEPDAGFRVWSTDNGPPTHSIPPHLVAKAAARISAEGFEDLHARLLDAYFRRNLDITDCDVLLDLWKQSGLPAADFDQREDPSLLEDVLNQHQEAVQHGASGVPAVRVEGHFGVLMGAQPVEIYSRWLEKLGALQ